MNMTIIPGGICAPVGFKAAGIQCGLRKNKSKKDLALIYADQPCVSAAVYTQNKVKAAPLLVTMQNLADSQARAVIVNSANANACNKDGLQKAHMMCKLAADALSIPESDVIVSSTGVIGQTLPIEPIANHIDALAAALSHDGGGDAAEAILTTDTVKKEIAVSFETDGKICKIGAMAKGSGMIHPNMATLLCFVTTDAAISPQALSKTAREVCDDTFNMVSVDGDTSTNDMMVVMASGLCGNQAAEDDQPPDGFKQALMFVCTHLAKEIAKDGEGATKLLECTVTSAGDIDTARSAAKSVISSSLFKSAMFGKDANWGRILCAVGYSGGEIDTDKIAVSLSSCNGEIEVCRNGTGLPFDEQRAADILSGDEIKILIDLGEPQGYSASAWGCDLTYDYVKINGDYRT
ncbi:MAG: bifunctional ornithine acetyltransferase/N-acetylglutamate synthase [Oscillospiraceae bacterium]|nr:bifunctional ornithine acetyltransferase/N-acetylglutamate synthase [Oscillospiraceae bacterium]